jgi:hypothetical protein
MTLGSDISIRHSGDICILRLQRLPDKARIWKKGAAAGVIGKAERTRGEASLRFVVTFLRSCAATGSARLVGAGADADVHAGADRG